MALVDYEKLELGKDVTLEVNFSENAKEDGKGRLTIGKESAIIDLTELLAFAFIHATDEQKADFMPVRQTQVQKVVRQHRVIAKDTIKPGQALVVNCEIDVPLTVIEAIKGDMTKKVL